ncbi:DUF1446 domain-containing protein [Alteromonas sp. McT4-15]|uniref:acyclic terpene utilization AtuA family protein n=1 Tax=Alteromonas sp. McT4-15 TaxID=2881256 RepID=UPI001CF83AFC|nr:acyclic terpene utilization AtuA family protein [Alteromonas sp. McT4-15]MCB4435610.1 DUF1446 domain-containing protein [Alteromonas sp. McT4-15]
MRSNTVRIGGASAFYGDSQLSARQLVDKGNIDYLVFDYLAEVTMAILSQAHKKDPRLGYAIDFVTVAMNDVLKDCAEKGIKIIANAGGVNVPGCIAALKALCAEKDINLNIVGVYGDNLLPLHHDIDGKQQRFNTVSTDTSDLDSGRALPEHLSSMNAYLGATPIADALAAGADIVITGRVVDSALVLGPLIHEFNWQTDDYDLLAQGALAGHIIECGAQCTGGNFTDWETVPNFANMSYPIAEVNASGEFTVSIAPNTGGIATTASVAEQLVYEIGDPANYLLPDVACDFTDVHLTQISQDNVMVSGAKGRAPGNNYKVCATYVDGFKLTGTFFIAGLNVKNKALANINALVSRTEHALQQKGMPPYIDTCIEILGTEATFGPHATAQHAKEVVARFTLHHNNIKALYFAASEMAYLATSAAPGMAAFGTGRPKPQPLIRIHSFLIDKSTVDVQIQKNDTVISSKIYDAAQFSEPAEGTTYALSDSRYGPIDKSTDTTSVPLIELAYARSGDKGDNLNIGVIARHPYLVRFLYHALSESVVQAFFAYAVKGDVKRYSLPGINGFNFFITQALGGGGTASLRTDSQGKSAAQTLLTMMLEVPTSLMPYTKSGGR